MDGSKQTVSSSLYDLSLYQLNRIPQQTIEDDTETVVTFHSLYNEFKCPICLDLLRNTILTKECLHRFCYDCITKALNAGNEECPLCLKKLVSLCPDLNFDQIISLLYPGRNEYKTCRKRIFSEIDKKGLQREDSTAKRHAVKEMDIKQVETATVVSSASKFVTSQDGGNFRNDNSGISDEEKLVLSIPGSTIYSYTDTKVDQDDQIVGLIHSLHLNNVDTENSTNLEIFGEFKINETILHSISDIVNDNAKSLYLETDRGKNISLQPSSTTMSCIDYEDNNTMIELDSLALVDNIIINDIKISEM